MRSTAADRTLLYVLQYLTARAAEVAMSEDTPAGLLIAAARGPRSRSQEGVDLSDVCNTSLRGPLAGSGNNLRRGSHVARFPGSGPVTLPPANHFVEAGLWGKLIEGCEIVNAPAGALLYEAVSRPPLLAILEGIVRVYIRTAGGRQFTLRYARAGDLVGLSAALSARAQSSTVAVTNAKVALLSLDRLRELSARNGKLAWPIAKQMARWSSDVDMALVDLEHGPMTARIAGHLLESATTKPGGGTRVRISQEDLAVAAGTVREVASRSLADLREAGVVITRRGTVVIVDRLRLAQVARGSVRAATAAPAHNGAGDGWGFDPAIPTHPERHAGPIVAVCPTGNSQ